jgi:hypothetical protein
VANPARRSAVLDRGVYEADYLVDGLEVLVAIDSRGNARKHLKLKAGVSYDHAKRWLEQLLDRIDPPTTLRLVSHEEPLPYKPVAPFSTVSAFPTHADDPRAYRRRLAKAAMNRVRIFGD